MVFFYRTRRAAAAVLALLLICALCLPGLTARADAPASYSAELKLKLDGDTIADGAFVGDGCAISQASADIMLGMVIGRKKDEALELGDIFLRMIQGEASEEEIDRLEEAGALRDIAAEKPFCAVAADVCLPWTERLFCA